MKNALDATSNALGDLGDKNSALSLLLAGKYPENVSIIDGGTHSEELKSKVTLSRKDLIEVLAIRMKSYLSLIEEEEGGRKYMPELLSLCDSIEKSNFKDENILNLCAQAFTLSGNYTKAEEWLWKLVKQNPQGIGSWNVLFILAYKRGDLTEAKEIARMAIDANGGSEELLEMQVCAHMSATIGEWEDAIYFGERAYVKNSHHLQVLYILCAARVNLGRKDEAYQYYQQMKNMAPHSPETKKVEPIFE